MSRGAPPVLSALVAAWVALAPSASAQAPTPLHPADPAYRHLSVLEDAGLVPRGLTATGALSSARVRWLVADARRWLSAGAAHPGRLEHDLEAALRALEARFPEEGSGAAVTTGELELGGGRSPGRGVPTTDLGSTDASVNPLASALGVGSGGRAFGDRSTAALAVRVDVPLGGAAGLSLGGRGSVLRAAGATPHRDGAVAEAAALHVRLGRLSLGLGRQSFQGGSPGLTPLSLGPELPPLDALRLATDRPVPMLLLGDVDLQLFAADLGPRQFHPHTKLFGVMVSARPVPALEVGLTLLNKQGGDGAPEATLAERLRDVSWVGNWFVDDEPNISDKQIGVGARLRTRGLRLDAEAAFTDFDHQRPDHTFRQAAGYRLAVEAVAVDGAGRHALGLEGVSLGPHVYRHQPFRSGWAVERFPMGWPLDPDSESLSVWHRYRAPASGVEVRTAVALDRRSADGWRPSEFIVDQLVRVDDRPEEWRARATLDARTDLHDGRTTVTLGLGGERVRSFGFVQGADRTNWAFRLAVWRAF